MVPSVSRRNRRGETKASAKTTPDAQGENNVGSSALAGAAAALSGALSLLPRFLSTEVLSLDLRDSLLSRLSAGSCSDVCCWRRDTVRLTGAPYAALAPLSAPAALATRSHPHARRSLAPSHFHLVARASSLAFLFPVRACFSRLRPSLGKTARVISDQPPLPESRHRVVYVNKPTTMACQASRPL